MEEVTTIEGLRMLLEAARAQHRCIGFVPTMGALHEGHLSLVRNAKRASDYVVVSIFVNPLQFAPSEDLAHYPRDMQRDLALLAEEAVDVVFCPTVEELYAEGFATRIDVTGPAEGLCGSHRPGHFSGVATVVAKLFNIVMPDVAVFGQKDLQQCAVIRRMVADLNMPIEIVMAPIVRESDGLAMSSRNAYLSSEERQSAPQINRALQTSAQAFHQGERQCEVLRGIARETLDGMDMIEVEYLETVCPYTMQILEGKQSAIALVVAVHLGKTRLIDNIIMAEDE